MSKEKASTLSSIHSEATGSSGALPVKLSLPKGFSFDEKEHKYFLGDVEIPGFTYLLKESELIDDRFYTEFSRSRGKSIHLAVQLDNEGDLDESTLDPKIVPYLKAWREFKNAEQVIPIPELMEKPIASSIHRFGTTPDVPAYFGKDKIPVIIELKSSAIMPWWGRLQTACQQIALKEVAGMSFPVRIGLRLGSDGRCQRKDYINPRDREDFLSLVRAHWLKKEKK